MGRVAIEENDQSNYNFFCHLSNYMVGMDKIPEAECAQEARNIVIQKISSDETLFTRVSSILLSLNLIYYKMHIAADCLMENALLTITVFIYFLVYLRLISGMVGRVFGWYKD